MSTILINKKDEIVMRLVHYFITKENYTPIVVNGAKDEVWLENNDGPYRVIRINSNYIHNKEQYNFDLFKTRSIIKQIKKKTMSIKIPTLNILVDVNDGIDVSEDKEIKAINVKDINNFYQNDLVASYFPNISNEILDKKEGLDLIMNVSNDLNKKTNEENQRYEDIFRPKKPIVTYILMGICIIVFILMYVLGNGSEDNYTLLNFGANYGPLVKMGEYYRLITAAFIHIGAAHIIYNMYALYVFGKQLEGFLGRWKYIAVYFVSALTGCLLSLVFNPETISAGASGAIFGLLGSLLYFGYHYRVYLGSIILKQIVPLVIINLVYGFIQTGVDNFAHIGGLVGGILTTMALGIPNKGSKAERINGGIVLFIYIAFMVYMVFFR